MIDISKITELMLVITMLAGAFIFSWITLLINSKLSPKSKDFDWDTHLRMKNRPQDTQESPQDEQRQK